MSLEYSWGSAGFGEKGKKGTFVWGLDLDTGGVFVGLETPQTGSSPLLLIVVTGYSATPHTHTSPNNDGGFLLASL